MARKWVLVVDDDAEVRAAWVEALEAAGYAAVAAANGLAAGELLRDVLPDVVVLDLRMPHMSGAEFLETARAGPWKEIPVIVVSGYLDHEVTRGVASGLNVVAQLQKPIGVRTLLGRIKDIIDPPTTASHRRRA